MKSEASHDAKTGYKNNICDHIPNDGLIPVDFAQPADCTWEDLSAAVIVPIGMRTVFMVTYF